MTWRNFGKALALALIGQAVVRTALTDAADTPTNLVWYCARGCDDADKLHSQRHRISPGGPQTAGLAVTDHRPAARPNPSAHDQGSGSGGTVSPNTVQWVLIEICST